MVDRETVAESFKTIQDEICSSLEECDGKAKFSEDNWKREAGGGGRTRIIQHGDVFEKGGVLFSAVEGELPPLMKRHFKVEEANFFATGVSIVIHPSHPMVPIIHMNIRYFEMEQPGGKVTRWFGGGIDLTPHYIDKDDAAYFHKELKRVCDEYDLAYYPRFKKWADDYFYLSHREETRGVGGIFFDHLEPDESKSAEDLFEFVKAVGRLFAPSYLEIVNRKRKVSFDDRHKEWQKLRRGRYVEFNLIHDRGTKFGLETKGRTESILMSLPETAGWVYNYQAEKGSEEEATLNLLKKDIDWLNL